MLLLAAMPAAASTEYNAQADSVVVTDYSDWGNSFDFSADSVVAKKKRKGYQTAEFRHIQRVDRSDMEETFIPRGIWMTGVLVNYREWDSDNTNLLVLKNLNMKGHMLSVSPALGFFVKDNMAVGIRYSYSRNYFNMASLDLNLGEDFNINLEDLYYLDHTHEGSAFLRYYMPLFGSKVFGAFTEARLTYSQSTGKNSTGRRDLDHGINTLDATFGTSHGVELGVIPGLCIFVTDFASVETSIGVFGVNYNWSKHKNLHPNAPDYEYSKSHSGGANFKFNLFSVNIGMTFYL